ncbi:MAG: hypothetical protein IKR18_02700, partial [Bacteroidaceae bacterium]|nr:hypothetical protein [Bacteroidaceae bacterium]
MTLNTLNGQVKIKNYLRYVFSPKALPKREYTFNITDHLGNVRVVLNNGKSVVETNDYYPYGMLMDGGAKEVQPFKYSGKELDR